MELCSFLSFFKVVFWYFFMLIGEIKSFRFFGWASKIVGWWRVESF